MTTSINNNLIRNTLGQFKRTRKKWFLDNFDDGYVDNKGRMRVWLPKHPRAYKDGYILRAIVAYEAYHGVLVSKEFAIHHKDENRLNDTKGNLEKILFGVHSQLHNVDITSQIYKICLICGKAFYVPRWRLNQKYHVGKYCSHTCYNKRGYNR